MKYLVRTYSRNIWWLTKTSIKMKGMLRCGLAAPCVSKPIGLDVAINLIIIRNMDYSLSDFFYFNISLIDWLISCQTTKSKKLVRWCKYWYGREPPSILDKLQVGVSKKKNFQVGGLVLSTNQVKWMVLDLSRMSYKFKPFVFNGSLIFANDSFSG